VASVTVKQVHKFFGQHVHAVNDVSLDVKDREFLVLLGPSGCGKTTLLRCIAGLEMVTAGEIYIGDTLVNFLPPKDRDIAMVFQNYALYPHMDVKKNISLGLKMHKYPRNLIEERVDDAGRFLRILELMGRMPRQLSGGQQQRVALGRALVREPKVFLMDEPLSNLDARLRVAMRAELIRLHRQLEATVIYVTHDQSEAMTMATRIVVMRSGVVQQVGDPVDVYRNPVNKYVAAFMGNPEMNFLSCKVGTDCDDEVALVSDEFTLKVPPWRAEAAATQMKKKTWLGFRPEALTLSSGDEKVAFGILGIVDVVEPMGSNTLIHVKVNQEMVVADVRTETHPTVGEKVTLALDPNRFHLFDGESERSLW
jgi:multiple sugar transport system ATP-binding protein